MVFILVVVEFSVSAVVMLVMLVTMGTVDWEAKDKGVRRTDTAERLLPVNEEQQTRSNFSLTLFITVPDDGRGFTIS